MNEYWTDEDQEAALEQGWGLFAIDGNPLMVVVQRYDVAEKFASDKDALSFVCQMWLAGDPLATRAVHSLMAVAAQRMSAQAEDIKRQQKLATLEDDLNMFSGTDYWHQWSDLYPNFVITDGVKYLADVAEAYWLLDVIASWNVTTRKVYGEPFQVWKVAMFGDRAVVKADDGNGKVIARQEIPFVTLPLKNVKLYAEYNGSALVICLPKER